MAVPVQRQIKVLRIGILQDGKIVQEKRIRPGETVSIGESAKCTFSYKIPKLPSRFPMFVAKGDKYTLCFTEAMSGKVAHKDGVASLEQLRAKGAVKKADSWSVPLDEDNRGKISIDNVTVLFQFVPAPPEPLHPTTRTNFKPRMIEENDPAFYGFLGLYGLLALIFVIYVSNSEPVELVSIDEVQERLVELQIIPPQEKKVAEVTGAEKPEEKKPDSKKPEKTENQDSTPKEAKRQPTADELRAMELKRQQAMKEEVANKSLVLKMLGTRGESATNSVVQDLISESTGVGQDLNSALQGVTGSAQATDEMMASSKDGTGAGTGRTDAGPGELTKMDGGSANMGTGPKTAVKGKMKVENAEVDGGDSKTVLASVNKQSSAIIACYESSLKSNPTLSGRVDVKFVISKGRVSSATIESNDTGDTALGSCIVSRVRRWSFSVDLENVEVVFPFILSPGN